MQKDLRIHFAVGFAVACLAVAVPYWQIPYARLSLPNGLYGWGLAVVALVAAVLRGSFGASIWRSLVVPAVAVPAVVLARVVADGFADPTSHNLWPFEVVIALIVGVVAATPGAIVGSLLAGALARR